MIVTNIIKDDGLKHQEKVTKIVEGLMTYDFGAQDLVNEAEKFGEKGITIIMEAIEYVSRYSGDWADSHYLTLAIMSLGANDINLIRTSAQVIANLAPYYPDNLENVIELLKDLSVSDNHAIRMNAALALEQVYKQPKYHNVQFWQMLATLYEIEKKENIKKVYQRALDS